MSTTCPRSDATLCSGRRLPAVPSAPAAPNSLGQRECMPCRASEVVFGKVFPIRSAPPGRARRQFRAVLGPCHEGRALPVRRFRGAGDRAHRAAGIHRRGLARLPARCAARHRLRLSRPRPLRAGGRPPLQPQQAGARPLCRGSIVGRAQLEPGAVRLHAGASRRRPDLRRARQRALHAEVPGHRPRLHLGPRPSAARCRGSARSSTRRMCGASPSCIPTAAREHARHLSPASAVRTMIRLHQAPRRHRGRAAADPRLRRRQLPASRRA